MKLCCRRRLSVHTHTHTTLLSRPYGPCTAPKREKKSTPAHTRCTCRLPLFTSRCEEFDKDHFGKKKGKRRGKRKRRPSSSMAATGAAATCACACKRTHIANYTTRLGTRRSAQEIKSSTLRAGLFMGAGALPPVFGPSRRSSITQRNGQIGVPPCSFVCGFASPRHTAPHY